MISREVSVCNLRRNSESYSGLQPGLNGNPFFAFASALAKKIGSGGRMKLPQ